MNPPKVNDLDFIHFLIAGQKVFTCTEAARSQPEDEGEAGPAHDAFTRLLQRRPPTQEFLLTEALWQEAESFVDRGDALLILDDTTLDKPHANQIEHVTWHWSGKTWHWSGKHGRAVKGINLLTLLWGGPPSEKEEKNVSSDDEENEETTEAHFPCDFRLYNKDEDGLTKNDHFRQMLGTASERGFDPEYVVFDSWYSGLDNLKKIRSCEWDFFTRLKSNRQVNPDDTYNRKTYNRNVRDLGDIPEEGRVVHLKGFGFVRVFRTGSTGGDAKYWATNDLDMTEKERAELTRRAWGVETYHRQLKQYCGAESSQHRSAQAQHNHVLMSIRAFLRLEVHRLRSAVSFYKSQAAVIREAIRAYLADPAHILPATA